MFSKFLKLFRDRKKKQTPESKSLKKKLQLVFDLLEDRMVPASFAAGNLAVLQADSASANNTTGTILELLPGTANQTTPVQAISILGTGTDAIRLSGSASTSGYVSNSNDGSLLVFTGHNSVNTSVNANTLNPRAVVAIDPSGNYELAATYTGASGNQTRSATTINNSDWFIADQGGIFTNNGTVASPAGNIRAAKAFGGTVYIGTASTTGLPGGPVLTVSAPSGGSFSALPGLASEPVTNFTDFYLIRSGDNGQVYDTLYTISASSSTAGTVRKYALQDTNNDSTLGNSGDLWVAMGSYTTNFGGFGLAAADHGNGAYLYITSGNGATAANSVRRLHDEAGYNQTLSINTSNNTLLYTSAAGTTLKGIAFAPVAPQAPPAFTSANSTSLTIGTPGNFTFTATGNPTPTFSLNASLPSGLTFNGTLGTITGTPGAGTAGVYNFLVTATNGVAPDATQNFTLTISASASAPSFTSATSTTFFVGSSGSFNVTADGSPTPTFSTNGTLPTGVTLSSAGLLSGTPASGTAGSYNFTITATNGVNPDATQSFTLTVAQSPAFTSAASTIFHVGAAGTFTFTTTPGFPANTTYSINGTLPAGVVFDGINGTLSGTPATGSSGAYPITISATNGVAPAVTQNFTLRVFGTISYDTVGATYTQDFDGLPNGPANTIIPTTGLGNGPFALSQSPFNNNASLDGWYASKFAGTSSNMNARIDDGTTSVGGFLTSYGNTGDRALGSIAASEATPRFGAIFTNNTSVTLNQFTINATGEQWRVGGTGRTNTLTFGYQFGAVDINTGSFQPLSGLNFSSLNNATLAQALDGNGNTQSLTGTVTGINWLPGQTLVIRWSDADDPGSDDGLAIDDFSFTATTLPNSAPVITSANATTFVNGQSSSFLVTTQAVPAPTFSASGLPGWLTMNSTTGLLSGTPPLVTVPTPVNLTITADNGISPAANQTFTLTVLPSTISYSTPGSNYTQNFNGLPNSGVYVLDGSPGPIQLQTQPINASNLYGWYAAEQSSTPQPLKFTVDDGLSTTGSLMSYGVGASTDRALGSLASGSVAAAFGAVFVNDSNLTLDQFTVTYTGEQYRKGLNSIANTLTFAYQIGSGSNISAGNFTTVSNLSFTAPFNDTGNVSLDGNVAGNQTLVSATVAGISWAPGQTLILRWKDIDEAGGDDGLAIDDLTFSAMQTPVNQTLSITAPTTQYGFANQDINFSPTWNNNVSLGGAGNISLTLNVANGTLSMGAANILLTGNGTGSLTANGTAADLNSALNNLTFTPTAQFEGVTTLAMSLTDGNGTAAHNVSLTISRVVINEVFVNPPGTDTPNEYLEIRSTLPNFVMPFGTYFAGIEGDGAGSGDVQTLFELAGKSTGSNGIMVFLQNGTSYTADPAANAYINANGSGWGGNGSLSTIGFSADGTAIDIENASATFMLVQTPTLSLSDDIDTNNDGTLDVVPANFKIVDSIGFHDNSAGDLVYGMINFGNGNAGVSATGPIVNVGFTPGYMGRVGNSIGATASDWVVADALTGTAPNFVLPAANSTIYPTTVSGSLNHVGANNSFTVLVPPTVTLSGNASYTENANATTLDAGLTLADGDSTNLVGATVSITSNFAPGQDVLTFTPAGNINGTFSNGTLTLTGNDTLANYQTVLRSVQYSNPSDNPSTALRTVTFTVNDGTSNGTQNLTLNVIAVNDAPIVATSSGNATFAAAGAITIDGNLTLSDVDSPSLAGATISITNYFAGQDVLGFANTANITGSFNATTGVLTLSGNDTLAAYQTALRSVTYNNTLGSGNTTPRIVAFQVNDGAAVDNLSNLGNKTVAFDPSLTAPPRVTSFTPTSSGFVATFSKPLVTSVLNLYDQSSLLGPTDVTLVGNTVGAVRGSLIVNAAGDQITFVKTGAPLANDTYTVTLRSGSDAFHHATAGLLDGNADNIGGDDYTNSFVRNVTGAVTVGVPDFARGYGQAVNVPNPLSTDLTQGIPVTISSGIGVSSLDFTIQYDPSLLTIDHVRPGTALAAGTSVSYQVVSAGTINVTISNTTDITTTSGPITLVHLVRSNPAFPTDPNQYIGPLVPNNATYGSKHVLDITNLHVFDSTPLTNEMVSVDDDGVHIAAYAGDLNGSQTYNAPDTSNNQRLVLSPSTAGLAAYQLADPIIIADITGNGLIQANDTTNIQRLILNQAIPFVPARPGLPVTTVGLDPQLFLSTSTSSAAPGQSFTLTLSFLVTEPGGITFSGADAALTYDASRFTINSVTPGGSIGTGFSSLADFATPGIITFTTSSGTLNQSKAFNTTTVLFNANVTVNAGASAGNTTFNLMQSAGGVITAMYDGTAFQNELDLVPDPTDGVDANDATFTVTGGANVAPTLTPATGTLAYTENAGALVLDNTFVVADSDSANLAGATITFAGGYVSGEDVLTFVNQNGINGTFHAGNGTLVLTGSSSLANYQAALRSITYTNNSENPSTANRTLSIVVNDGTDSSAAVTRTITVAAVNDAPTVTPANGTLAYTLNASAAVIDNTFVVGDVDSTTLTGATVTFTGGFATGDVLTFVDQSGINGTFNASNGTLTLSGNATLANYQTALRSITFSSNSTSTANRTLSFVVNDGAGVNNLSTAVTRTVTVSAASQVLAVGDIAIIGYRSDAPDTFAFVTWVDLQPGTSINFWDGGYVGGGDGTGIGIGGGTWRNTENFATWTNSTGSTIVAGTVIVVQDLGGANGSADLGSVVGNLNGLSASGDQIFAGQGSFNSTTATAVFNGTLLFGFDFNGVAGWDASATDSQTSALPSGLNTTAGNIAFGHIDNGQYSGPRSFPSITAAQAAVRGTANYTFDDLGNGTAATISSVDFTFVANNPPTVTPASGSLTYTENANATVLDNSFVVADDGATLTGATITFTGGYQSGQDVLGFVSNANITGSFNATTGTLTLTGNTTLANYQDALRSITYVNNSDNPSTANRTLSITVNDGVQDSAPVTRTIGVIAVNDAPVLAATSANGTFNVGGGPVVIDSALTLSDVDSATLVGAAVAVTGNFVTGQDVLAFTNTANITGSYDSSSGLLTLAGTDTVANYQAALRSVTYNNTSGSPDLSPRTISFQVDDGAAANNVSNLASRVIEIVAAPNSPPTLTPATGTLNYNENAGAVVLDNSFVVSDDGPNLASATITFTGGYVNGQDVLGFVNQNGINGTFDAGNGTLTLTGNTTLANYQTALRSITYTNNSDNPSTANRTLSIVISDGTLSSTAATRTIIVAAVNDAPAFNAPAATTGLANGTIVFSPANGNAISITDLDAGAGNLTLTLNASNGNLSMNGTNLSLTGNGTSSISATGSLVDLNAALNGLRLTPTLGFTGSANLSLNVTDLGNSGGAAQQANATIGLTVAQIYINEIMLNPSGPDAPNEYLEIRSSIPNFTLPAGTYLVGVEGDSGGGPGDIQDIFNLSGRTTGSNGILVLLQQNNTYSVDPNATVVTNAAGGGWGTTLNSTIGHSADGTATDIENASVTFFLIQSYIAPTLTDDIDAGNNGTLGGAFLNWNVQDSIGILDGGATDVAYGALNFANSGAGVAATGPVVPTGSLTGGYIGRIGNSTGSSAADWVVSETNVTSGTAPNWVNSNLTQSSLLIGAPLNHIGAPNNWIAPPQVSLSNATLTYTENAGAVALDPNLNVADFDSTTLTSASIVFTGGYVNGQDILSFTDQNGINGTFDAGNGTLTLTGNASLSNYQTALRSITYTNNSENPSTANRTLAITVSDGLFTSAAVHETIVVVAVNDAPVVTANQTFALNENSANGTIVGTLTATDVDGSTFTNWTITGGNTNGAFAINPTTGQISVANSTTLDREAFAFFALQVTVSDGVSTSSPQTVTINLNDLNDVLPVVTANQTFALNENSANGTSVGTLAATDGDITATTFQNWAIAGGNTNGAFAINPTTGQISVANSTALDREATAGFTLQVTVSDGVNTSAPQNVTITLNDVNDVLPVVTANQTFTLNENSANGTSVGTLAATDGDITATTFQNWAIAGGNTNGAFAINPTTGQISVANSTALDREATAGFTLQVTVSDGVNTSAPQNVTITLNDVNDVLPVVTANQTFNIADNAANGSFVGTLAATDGDVSPTTFGAWQITGGNTGGAFALNPSNGTLTVANNASLSGVFTLQVTVSDGVNTSATQTVTVNVNNTNVNPPVVTANQTFTLNENSANGTSVGTVAATDADGPTTFQNWTIAGGNTNGAFAINPTTGQISVANSTALDREATAGFTLQVTVSDGVNTSAPQNVTITLNDVNDVLPVVTANQTFTLNENSANGTSVGTLAATDGDITATTFQNWAIAGGNTNGAFAINPTTGQISVANSTALDREATAGFTLQVTVSDGVNTSAPQNVTITLNDVNDVLPVVTANQTFNIADNAANGSFVGTLAATDGDVSPTTFGAWQITGGNTGGAFALNPSNGTLTVANNASLSGVFTLQVTVSDGVNTSATQTVAVNVIVTNTAPTLTPANGTLFYTENAGAVVLDNSFVVGDDGGTLAGATIVFTGGYVGGQDALGFTNQNGISGTFHASNGTLSLTGAATLADYQTALRSITYTNNSDNPSTANRTLSITLNDGSLSSTPVTRIINVTAVNDAPTVTTTAANATFTVGGGAIVIDTGLSLADLDSLTLSSATVQITGNYVNGQDFLGFTNQNGINGTFHAGNGTLSLAGSATLANYQTALRSITYNNASGSPSFLQRTVSFQVNDGAAANNLSNVATRNISIFSASNVAPTLITGDLTFSYAAVQSLAVVNANDPNSDPLFYSATIDSVGHFLRSTYSLSLPAGTLAGLTSSPPSAANLWYNYGGKQEKWFAAPGGVWYFILPNGDFYRWNGAINQATGTKLHSVSPLYWQDPARIRDEVMGDGPIDFSISGNQLTFDNPTHYEGQFRVTVTVTDGALSDTKSFFVNFTNLAPTLDPIANQTMPPSQDTITVSLVASDPESDTLTYSATVQSQAQFIKSQIGSKRTSDLGALYNEPGSTNYGRLGEKWIYSFDNVGNKISYFILPSGDLYLWDKTPFIAQGTFLANVGTNIYANPLLLVNPATAATTSFAGSNLTIDPVAGFTGNLIVTARATDPRGNFANQSFTITVAPAPTLTQPTNVLITGATPTPITLSATDPSGLPLTYSVTSEALMLKNMYGLSLSSAGLYTNYFGMGEKWLVGAGTNTWYYIKPNGDLFRWVGATGGTGTYVRTLDTRYHTNPALLYNAHTQATFNIVGNVLTVTPSAGFTGNLVLTVFANNGTFQDNKTFIVTVS